MTKPRIYKDGHRWSVRFGDRPIDTYAGFSCWRVALMFVAWALKQRRI